MFFPREGEDVFASSCLTLFGPEERTYEAAHDLYEVNDGGVALFLGPVFLSSFLYFFYTLHATQAVRPGRPPIQGVTAL